MIAITITNPGVYITLGLIICLGVLAVGGVIYATKKDQSNNKVFVRPVQNRTSLVNTLEQPYDWADSSIPVHYEGVWDNYGPCACEDCLNNPNSLINKEEHNMLTIVVRYHYTDGTNRLVWFENMKDRVFYEDDNEDIIVGLENLDVEDFRGYPNA